MDPQHRLLLQATVDVLQGASVTLPEATGVMVGMGTKDVSPDTSALPVGQHSATGIVTSVAPGRYIKGLIAFVRKIFNLVCCAST